MENKKFSAKQPLNLAVIFFYFGLLLINYFGIQNRPLFHFLAELITVVISCCLFAMIWILREKIDNGYFLIVGTGLLFASFFDLMHILTFEGISIVPDLQLYQSHYFWLVARLLQGLTFVLAPIFIGIKTKHNLAIWVCLILTLSLAYLIIRFSLPSLVDTDGSFSAVRIAAEILIIALFALSVLHVYQKKARFDPRVFRVVFGAAVLAMASEIIISLNTSETHLVSILGLNIKILSYLLIFQIILVIGITRPQEVFYRELQTSWEQLQDLFMNTNEGICIIDQHYRIIQSNPAALKIFGAKNSILNKTSIYEFLPIDKNQNFVHSYAMLQQNKPVSLEIEIMGADQQKRMIELAATPRFLENKFIGYFMVLRDITDQNLKEKRLEEARRLYQTIFMDAPIRIWEFDYSKVKQEIDVLKKQGIKDFLLFFNQHPQKLKEFAGLVKVNAYNKLAEKLYINPARGPKVISTLNQIFWEESYLYFVQELLTIVEGKTTNSYEMSTRSPDGNIHTSIINWVVLPDHEQDYSRVIISANDITERKQAELELLASEVKFRLLAENAGVGISYFDPDGSLIFTNEKALEAIGGNLQEHLGKNVTNLLNKKDGALVKSRIIQSIRSPESLDFENIFDTRLGKKWFHTTYMRMIDKQGTCIGVQVISDDITNRKDLEFQLQSLARFPEENPNPVLRFSKSGKLLYANKCSQAILAIWNYTEQNGIPVEYQSIIEKCLLGKQKALVNINVDTRIFSLYFSPIPDMNYVNIYGRDITDLKKAEVELMKYSKGLEKIIEQKTNELIEAQERLVRQEKLAVMGQLASGVGHELRNPLAVINNALYMLRLSDHCQDPAIDEYLNIIDQEVAASNKIITDLLTFARIKPANLNPVDLRAVLAVIFRKFVPPEIVQIKSELTQDLPPVYVDDKQVEQVITNLVTNAYQAMPEGGSLTIKSEIARDLLKIDFIDTGIGIPPENLEKIFEPLFTTKAKGIGLGLTISKMLAEINGGKIKVKSKVGQGSTFSLFLPIDNKM